MSAPATLTHDDLVQRAERWLTRQGCSIVIRDPFRTVMIREQPDAIGWQNARNVSLLIECKVSRADFWADRQKPFRANPAEGVGSWRFYLTPEGVIQPDDLPAGWGLLWATPRRIRAIHGIPRGNCHWATDAPFVANKGAENQMLVSALRRLALRGHLPAIYDGVAEISTG